MIAIQRITLKIAVKNEMHGVYLRFGKTICDLLPKGCEFATAFLLEAGTWEKNKGSLVEGAVSVAD